MQSQIHFILISKKKRIKPHLNTQIMKLGLNIRMPTKFSFQLKAMSLI
jgi:hypothetical protein